MKMKKMLVTMATTAVVAAGVCATSAFADFPAQWTYTYNEGAEESVNSNIYVMNKKDVAPLDGNYYLHAMIPPKAGGNEINGNRYARSEPMQLEDGKQYKLTFWYCATEGDHPYYNNVRVADINNPGLGVGDREGGNEENFNNTHVESKWIDGKEWKKCVYTFTYHASKSEAPCVYFLFRATYNDNETLEYFIDDCTVVATDDPTETNLLSNGNFDTPADNYKTPWTVFSTDGKGGEMISTSRAKGSNIDAGAQHGSYTLKFSYGPDGYHGMTGAYSNSISLKKGKKYTLTFAMKENNFEGAMFNFRFAKAETPWDGIAVVEGSTRLDWNGYDGWTGAGNGLPTYFKTFTFTANNDYENLRLSLMINCSYGNAEVYIDNVRLTEEGSDMNLIEDGSFETNPGNDYWNIEYRNVPAEASAAIVDKEDGATGPYWADGVKAVRIFYPYNTENTYTDGGVFLWSKPIEGLEDGAEYTLKFYYKGDTDMDTSARFGLAGTNDVLPLSKINSYPLTDGYVNSSSLTNAKGAEGKNDMNCAYITFTYHKLSSENPRVYFRMRGPGYGVNTLFYIDDVSLVKTGTTKNLIKDGSFEGISGKLTAGNASISGENIYMNNIIAKGKTTVSADVTNTTGSAKNVTLIAAYYYEDKLIALKTASDIVAADTEDKTISVDIDINEIDENGSYKLKCFVWDSVDGMMPILTQAQSFSAMDMAE